MKKFLKADQKNIGLLIDRFRKFIKNNKEKTFEVKKTWGKPVKRETWENSPANNKLTQAPKIGKHQDFGMGKCLFSIQLQNVADVINIYFPGEQSLFNKCFPGGVDLLNNPIHSYIINEGDKIFFKNNGIMVIPKREDHIVNKKCSFFFTAC